MNQQKAAQQRDSVPAPNNHALLKVPPGALIWKGHMWLHVEPTADKPIKKAAENEKTDCCQRLPECIHSERSQMAATRQYG